MDTGTILHAREGDTSLGEAIMDLKPRVIRSPRLPYFTYFFSRSSFR